MSSVQQTQSSALNRSAYASAEAAAQYARDDYLYPAETQIFRRYKRQFGQNVLDIAIGAGRTTRALLPSCQRYVGVDLSPTMIASAKKRFPGTNLSVMDMRDVPAEFTGQRFDAILISFNGVDYVSWEDRCALIAAMPSLLAPDGVFVFSAHNLADVEMQRGLHLRPDLRANLRTAYRPRSLARLLLRAPPWIMKAYRNRRRFRGMERMFDGYAYVNDAAEDYGLLTVYVLMAKQADLLKAAGFSRVEIAQPWLRREQAYFNYFSCQV